LAARAFSVPRIVIVDVDENRLAVAKQLGADEIVQVTTNLEVLYSFFIFLKH
jgi:L-iditol 2-dehydrogenase